MSCLLLILTAALLALCVLVVPVSADITKTMTPRISVQEEYDDNINLDPVNEDTDWITLVSPGASLELQGPNTMVNLDYEAGFSFYKDDSSNDSTRHLGQVEWNQRLTQHLGFRASDTFVRSEDPILETDGAIEEIRRERSIEHRNDGQASLSFQFAERDQVTVTYTHLYVDNTSFTAEDSQGHEGLVNLDLWFSSQWGVALATGYTRGHFQQADDFDQYDAGLTLNHSWQEGSRLYARYDILYNDFEPPNTDVNANDYRVHQGALGLALALGPNTDFDAEGGYFVQDYLNGDQMDGVILGATLNARTQRISLRLSTNGGYDRDYFTSENLGSSEYRQVLGVVDCTLAEEVSAFASATYRWEEFFGADIQRDRKDEVWDGGAGVSFSFWRWFTLSLEGRHAERDSDDSGANFEDNRIILRLRATYPYVF